MFIKVNKSRNVTSTVGRLLEYTKYVKQAGCEDVKH